MKLTAKVFITLDGVYQGPGGADEDRRGGFERGGWQMGRDDDEVGAWIQAAYQGADALLLGRVTFDIWAAYWPHHDDHPIGRTINGLPKYVPSTTLQAPAWRNAHVLAGDVEAAVRELKAMPGRDLLLQGSGSLLRWLLARGLVDELALVVYPIVVGSGLRLFPHQGPMLSMDLVASRATPSGVTIQTYRPAGRPTPD